jgi:hypothetical protein
MNYLAKYKPETSIFEAFDVDQALPRTDLAFRTWEALLLAKRSHDGLFLVMFYDIMNLCLTNLKSFCVQSVKRIFLEELRKPSSALGLVKTLLKKLEESLGIKNIIQLSVQPVEKTLLPTIKR